MRKQNKTMCFDLDVLEFLDTQPNASALVQDLIYAEMKRLNDLKHRDKTPTDLSKLHETVISDAEAKAKKEAERKAHSTAWDDLDLEVRVEIKDLPDWGVKWHTIFYPMYAAKGSLTLKDVRDWYFANKEGYKV